MTPRVPVPRKLDKLPAFRFDCGREAQNRFLAEDAWIDQEERVSRTYLYFVDGLVAGYATLLMDGLELGTRERPPRIRYRKVPALKLAQLGVGRPFQRTGFGRGIVASVILVAERMSEQVGCRYVSLDAQPELVGWYEAQGFRINRVMQRQRLEAAARRGATDVAVSMRFDIRG